MIEAVGLTKRFGDKTAVDNVSFTVRPGQVTGFLGPNGAGKSTTMRMILGLDTPSGGSVTVNGENYRQIAAPAQKVGALLEAKAADSKRKARAHLKWIAQASGIDQKRVDAVIQQVGLSEVSNKKFGQFSLGMSQRLGIAVALLGDPPVLLFDEPVNGLDPEGILWVRNLMKSLASEGRTVLVSSHLMGEMEATADQVLVIGKGKILADAPMADFVKGNAVAEVKVVTPHADRLRPLLEQQGATVTSDAATELRVLNSDSASIGELAAQANIALHELTPKKASLEAVFMEMTRDSVEYGTSNEEAGK